MSNCLYRYAGLAGILAGTLTSGQALAREPGMASIEEVVITARRSEESQQSTPVTVNAFSAQSLRENSISNPEDLQISTPGVFLSGTGSRQNVIYQIRGQSKSVFGPNSPAVISYFAEVPDPFLGSFVPQYDLSSVQVLKGPQGTLFGRNTTGGAILYSPEKPGYEFSGYVSGIVGNYSKQELQGAVSLPVIDNKLAIRLAGDLDQRDAFTKNYGVGGEIDNVDSKSYRISVLFEPNEFVSNTTIYDYYRSDSGGTAQVIGDVSTDYNLLTQLGLQASALQQLELQRARGPYKTDSVVDFSDDKNERKSFINRTEIQISDDVQLVNIFGYRTTELSIAVNTDGMSLLTSDGTGAFPAGYPVAYIKAGLDDAVKQTSDEIQLRGQALDNQMDWLLGAFWLKSEPDGAQGSSVAFAQIPGAPVQAPGYNFLEDESKAIFGQVSIDLDSWLSGLGLDLGVRYTKDETQSCTASGTNTAAGPIVADSSVVEQSDCLNSRANVVNASTNSVSSEEVTWSVGVNWQVNDDLFTYLVSRHGYRAGGVNGPTFSGRLAPYQSFDPETVTDVEWGIRADWNVGEVDIRSNISFFLGQYDDVQSTLTGVQTSAICDPGNPDNAPGISPDGDCDASNDPNGGSILVNVGESQVSGVDFDLQIALTPNLLVNLGGNYLDMKTNKFSLPDAFAPYTASREIKFDLAAEKSFVAGIRYELTDLSFSESVVMNIDYYWTDEMIFSDGTLPSYDLTNLRLDMNNILASQVDLSVFVRNVFDDEYANSASSSGTFIGITSLVYGAPRMFGAEVRYSF